MEWVYDFGGYKIHIYTKDLFKKKYRGTDLDEITDKYFKILKEHYGGDDKRVSDQTFYVQYKIHVNFTRDREEPWDIEPIVLD